MNLIWRGQPGNVVAVGARGTYTVQTVGPPTRYVLQGVGHDELPMRALPAFGAQFLTLSQAQDAAVQIERSRDPEPRMSGA